MLSRLIVASYRFFIEIVLWLSLLAFVVTGYRYHPFSGEEIIDTALGAVLWLVLAVAFFGPALVLEDIRDRVKKIEAAKEPPSPLSSERDCFICGFPLSDQFAKDHSLPCPKCGQKDPLSRPPEAQ